MKVADFGQVRLLGGLSNTAPGVTPVYATPEAFDGRVSRHSDQYSLAVVYQEMLTGHRPFPGTTMMQLAAQHIGCQPMLAPLPTGDRTVIARALAKVPEHRFPSCLKLVEALLAVPRSDSLPRTLPSLPPAAPAGGTRPLFGQTEAPHKPAAELASESEIDALLETASPGKAEPSEGDLLFQLDEDALRETVIPEAAPAADGR